jgi:hypothetical protein
MPLVTYAARDYRERAPMDAISLTSTEIRERFLALLHSDTFIRRMLLHMINHRVQDFQDPLTSTLVLMATAPLQFVLCEAGLLVFKTNLLPVLPYALLDESERAQLHSLVQRAPIDQLHEAIESSGQYTLTVLPFTHNRESSPTAHTLCKMRLLFGFVGAMRQPSRPDEPHGGDSVIARTLSGIVLQRFWSRVTTPSETIGLVMRHLNECCSIEDEDERPVPTPPCCAGKAEDLSTAGPHKRPRGL